MEIKIKCDDCKGDGYDEVIKCTLPASMCCGGCYEKVWCENCNGTGMIDILIDDQEIEQLIKDGELNYERC